MNIIHFIRDLFRKKPRNVVYPFAPLINAMREKDPELWAEVGPMVPSRAIATWQLRYPEDFSEQSVTHPDGRVFYRTIDDKWMPSDHSNEYNTTSDPTLMGDGKRFNRYSDPATID